MAQGIDFTALINGERLADNANWANIRRIQQQEEYGLVREQQLAKQLQQRQNREASHYLSTVLPNLQRYADQEGMSPVKALINQRSQIMNDSNFQSMTPEVQTLIINGLGETAKLQAQALAKAGNHADLERLTGAFGGINPLNPLGVAVSSGDPLAVFNAVNERSPGAYTLTPDQKFVVDRAGNQVPLSDWAAYTAAGLGEANSAAGGLNAFQQAGQQQRAASAADDLKRQEQTYNALLMIKSGKLTPREAKEIFPLAVIPETPAVVTGQMPASGATGAFAGTTASYASTEPGVAGTPSPVANSQAPAASTQVPATSWQQLVTQVQAANAPQLNRSLATIVQQIEEGKARQEELSRLQAAYQAELNKAIPSFAERGVGQHLDAAQESYIAEIKKRLSGIDQEFGTIAQNMRGFEQIARQIQTRQRVLGLPLHTSAPQADWFLKLQSELSQ